MPVVYKTGDEEDEDDGLKEDGIRLTSSIHCVAEYANVSFDAALDYSVDMFRNLLRNHLISKLMETKDGREKLKLWKRIQVTEFDDTNLEFFKQFS